MLSQVDLVLLLKYERKQIMKWYRELDKKHPAKKHKHYNWSDDRGLYFSADFSGPDDGRKSRPRYDITHPVTGKPCAKPSGMYSIFLFSAESSVPNH